MTGPVYGELTHESPCPNCRIRLHVGMNGCRLERRPWRLEWKCEGCSQHVRIRLDARLVPMVIALDRVGGTVISAREVRDFVSELDDLEEHAAEELFYA